MTTQETLGPKKRMAHTAGQLSQPKMSSTKRYATMTGRPERPLPQAAPSSSLTAISNSRSPLKGNNDYFLFVGPIADPSHEAIRGFASVSLLLRPTARIAAIAPHGPTDFVSPEDIRLFSNVVLVLVVQFDKLSHPSSFNLV